MNAQAAREPRILILGVAASDAHAVANHLLAMRLRLQGFFVVNLGVCTPLTEFADAFDAYPTAEAVLIGSLNGHAYDDVRDLPMLRSLGRLQCPVVLGGNLSVGARKDDDVLERLLGLGVDHILTDADELPGLLDGLAHAGDRLAHAGELPGLMDGMDRMAAGELVGAEHA